LIFKKKKKEEQPEEQYGSRKRKNPGFLATPQSPGNPVHQIPQVTWYILSSVT
jgi:hypothetical protein